MEKLSLKTKDTNLLKVNFHKALKDPDFQLLVDSIDLENDILMKYTSKLLESSEEVKNCRNCKSLFTCKNKMTGYCYTPNIFNNALQFSYLKCAYQKEMDEKADYLSNVYFYEIPTVIRGAFFKNIYKDDANRLEIIKKLKTFYDNYKQNQFTKGIYLNGNFGSGKSYLIGALFNELAKLNYQSAIIYFPEFLRKLKSGFSKNGDEYKDLFDKIRKVPLLLIDDIGAEKLTDWARDEILGSILQYRMDFKLATFFTSNLTMKELENHLQITSSASDKVKARRIIERISFLTESVTLIGVNRRNEL